jgi:ParB/RepB/Spo0J family partition protein
VILNIDQVVVSRDRFREATGDMEALATSLARFGQLQPILVEEREDGRYELIAGYRRLTAHQMNGMTTIIAEIKSKLDLLMAKEMELEENIQREQMTWQEQQVALAELHKIKTQQDPNWTQAKTAVLADQRGQASIAEAIKITNAMKLFPELANAKNKNQALKWLETKAQQIVRVQEVKGNTIDYEDIAPKIWLGDSVDLIKQVPDESFHAVITDPPFGVDYGERVSGTVGSINSYEDDAKKYRRILTMVPDIYRTLKPNGFVVWFFGISWYSEVKEAFRAAGFTVDEIPIIWNRSEGRTFTNVPDHYFAKGYDVALHAFKGDPKLVKRGHNVVTIAPVEASERDFVVERPVELYEHFIKAFTIPGERVADFFVGSGSCPAGCARTGRDFFGCELSEERRAGAIQKIKAYTPEKK